MHRSSSLPSCESLRSHGCHLKRSQTVGAAYWDMKRQLSGGKTAQALSLGTARVPQPVSRTGVLSGCLCMRCFGHVLAAGSLGHTQDTQSKSRLARELVNVPTEEMWEVAVEKESGAWLNCCLHDRIGCRKWMDGCLVWCVHRMLHSRPNVPRTCNERWALSLMHMPRVVFLIMKCIIPLVYCSFDLMKIQFVL